MIRAVLVEMGGQGYDEYDSVVPLAVYAPPMSPHGFVYGLCPNTMEPIIVTGKGGVESFQQSLDMGELMTGRGKVVARGEMAVAMAATWPAGPNNSRDAPN